MTGASRTSITPCPQRISAPMSPGRSNDYHFGGPVERGDRESGILPGVSPGASMDGSTAFQKTNDASPPYRNRVPVALPQAEKSRTPFAPRNSILACWVRVLPPSSS
jgi:hypothetical protein